MAVVDEILTWSESLPSWQRDVLRRLFSQSALSPADLDDALALLKQANGIPDSGDRTPKPLSVDDVPAESVASVDLRILEIKDLEQVNAIAPKQSLAIAREGMTVVFGENGSGKSGYTRVLKRACRARDRSETIWPNLEQQSSGTQAAQATFTVVFDSKEHTLTWRDGEPSPAELSAVAIFDSRCAGAYLEEEDDFSYVPYGLRVLKELGAVCDELYGRIESELAAFVSNADSIRHLRGDTPVGQLIAGLSADTAHERVEELAKLSPAEADERSQLAALLMTGDGAAQAQSLRRQVSRLKSLGVVGKAHVDRFNDSAVRSLEAVFVEAKSRRLAADAAARVFAVDSGFLPGTGEGVWRGLFESARRYATISHPGQVFPDFGPSERCPLCQEPLEDGAGRLVQFEAFVKEDAARAADSAEATWSHRWESTLNAAKALQPNDETIRELEDGESALAQLIRQAIASADVRRESLIAGVAAGEWPTLLPVTLFPQESVEALASALEQKAVALESASDALERKKLQARVAELEARAELSKVKDLVLKEIAMLDRRRRTTSCLADLKTTAISLKATELAEKVISSDLRDALNDEFKALGVSRLSVALKTRSVVGQPRHRLVLRLPQTRPLSEVLSEGEQRAVALASFLTEVKLGGSPGGVVFDDPVSSLDHSIRERVAERLALEASKRQVLIFTHDVYFVWVLLDAARRSGVDVLAQSVTRRSSGTGVTEPSLPFDALGTRDRVSALRERRVEAARAWKERDDSTWRRLTQEAYRDLRLAWERAVEEVLFRSTVVRFRKSVETNRLIEVLVHDDDVGLIAAAMTKCSNHAHDTALLGGVVIPEPDELASDIEQLETWRLLVEGRAKAVRAARKQ